MLYIMEPNAPPYTTLGSSGDVINDVTGDIRGSSNEVFSH